MLTRRGLGLTVAGAALYAAGVALGYVELVLLGAGCLLPVAVGAVWMLRRPAITLERTIEPERVVRGQEAWGAVTFTNPGRLASSAVTAVERWGDERHPIEAPRLAAGASAAARYPLPTDRRRALDVGPLDLTREDPLALWRTVRTAGDVRRLWVHPVAHPLLGLPPGRTRNLEGARGNTIPQGSTTFHALREYVLGDDFRLIHWRSYARTGQLMVRENVDSSLPRITLLVDDRAAVHDPDGFEEAMDVAASVVAAAARAGYPVRLVTVGGRAVEERGNRRRASPRHTQQLLDALAELEPVAEPELRPRVASLALEGRGDTLVAVTGTAGRDDLGALGALARRYDDTVVVLVGPGAARAQVPAAMSAQVLRGTTAAEVAALWNKRL